MPLLTNSTTACEDWQSQMPARVSGEADKLEVPTVASYDQELVVVSHLMLGDVGVCCDYLLLRGKFGGLLELKVANGSGQRQVSVHSAEINKASRGRNSGPLRWHTSATP